MIHPTAIVDPGAELGKDVTVGPFAVIGPKVTIGDGTTVGSHAVIESHVRMGKGNRIHSFASVGAIPQDLKFRGEESWVEMGDGNIIREFATVNRGTSGGGGVTRVGNNTLVMAYCHIAHDCIVGSRVIMANAATLAGHVTIEDGAIIGGMTGGAPVRPDRRALHHRRDVGRHAGRPAVRHGGRVASAARIRAVRAEPRRAPAEPLLPGDRGGAEAGVQDHLPRGGSPQGGAGARRGGAAAAAARSST